MIAALSIDNLVSLPHTIALQLRFDKRDKILGLHTCP
jgi:hypothetical protein